MSPNTSVSPKQERSAAPGHFGVALQPRAIAEQLTRFFTPVPTAA